MAYVDLAVTAEPGECEEEAVFDVRDAHSPSPAHRRSVGAGGLMNLGGHLTAFDLGGAVTGPCSSRSTGSTGSVASNEAMDGSMRVRATDVDVSAAGEAFAAARPTAGRRGGSDTGSFDWLLQALIRQEGGIDASHAASRLSSPAGGQRRLGGLAASAAAFDDEAGLPIYEYSESQASMPHRPPCLGGGGGLAVPRLSMDWLLQLSQRSGAEETVLGSLAGLQSAVGLDGGGAGRHSRPISATSRATAAATAAALRTLEFSEAGTALDRLSSSGDEAEEEVVSVFDVSDEPASARLVSDARALLGDLARGGASPGILSPERTTPRRGGVRSDISVAESSLGAMLRRLALEAQILDESVTRSVRRAVAQHGASTGASTGGGGQRLSDDEIRALPKVRFEDEEKQHCAICLDAYQEGELLTTLRCDHFFHIECVARWLQRNTICPLCRMPSVPPPEDI